MVSEKKRRKALARAKHERQQARKSQAQHRGRATRVIAGTAVGVVVLGLVGFGVYHLVSSGSSTPEDPFETVQNTLTMKTPTNTSFVESFSSGSPTTATPPRTTAPKTTAPKTSPVTTGATGKATP